MSDNNDEAVISSTLAESLWNRAIRNSEISKVYKAVLELNNKYDILLGKLNILESKIDILINKTSYSPNSPYTPNLTPQTICQSN